MALGPLEGSKRYFSIHRNNRLYLYFYEWIEGRNERWKWKMIVRRYVASGSKITECFLLSVNISAGWICLDKILWITARDLSFFYFLFIFSLSLKSVWFDSEKKWKKYMVCMIQSNQQNNREFNLIHVWTGTYYRFLPQWKQGWMNSGP